VFSEEYRDGLRDLLTGRARADPDLIGVALTGSSSQGTEDRWSDIDMAVGVASNRSLDEVIADWTRYMYDTHDVVDHVDVMSRNTVYRVFLLANTLQIDIAFAPEGEFGARAATFRLLSGVARDQPWLPSPDPAELVGMAWLYALHARSSIARGKGWQAEYMISALRDQVVMLACLRHRLPAREGRGVDMLPTRLTESLEGALVRETTRPGLVAAFTWSAELLVDEIRHLGVDRADRIIPVIEELVGTTPDG
jgi:predicted nucleotidyltransferase